MCDLYIGHAHQHSFLISSRKVFDSRLYLFPFGFFTFACKTEKLAILALVDLPRKNIEIINKASPSVKMGPMPFQFDAYPTELTWHLLACLRL